MRIEKDSIGELPIPENAYYGIQSLRASQNFPISGTQVHISMLKSYLLLKRAAATANQHCKVLPLEKCQAIEKAVDLLLETNFQQHFIVDAYQAGAGTSQNMNANEVIANQANLARGGSLGVYFPINPNDDVNMSQSTNDTYPTAMRLAVLTLAKDMIHELKLLEKSFSTKGDEFNHILKAARTHLQDAVPIRLGQEFKAYAYTIIQLIEISEQSLEYLRVLGIGGSAVGTGINVPQNFPQEIIKELKILFQDEKLSLSTNLCASMQSQLPMLIYSHALRSIAVELTRIMNDLRLMSSGPNNGLAEILLPSTQPGSSIMPGKVNPSILEMGNQVCFKVIGNDQTMMMSAQAGQLELNVMMPIMAQVSLESTTILTNTMKVLREKCLDGIRANAEKCHQYAEQTSQIVTALNPLIGYVKAGEILKEALAKKVSVMTLIRQKEFLTEEQMATIFDLNALTGK